MWKVEVIADDTGVWSGNDLVFTTKELAEEYATKLMTRWTLVREWRVVEHTPRYVVAVSPAGWEVLDSSDGASASEQFGTDEAGYEKAKLTAARLNRVVEVGP